MGCSWMVVPTFRMPCFKAYTSDDSAHIEAGKG